MRRPRATPSGDAAASGDTSVKGTGRASSSPRLGFPVVDIIVVAPPPRPAAPGRRRNGTNDTVVALGVGRPCPPPCPPKSAAPPSAAGTGGAARRMLWRRHRSAIRGGTAGAGGGTRCGRRPEREAKSQTSWPAPYAGAGPNVTRPRERTAAAKARPAASAADGKISRVPTPSLAARHPARRSGASQRPEGAAIPVGSMTRESMTRSERPGMSTRTPARAAAQAGTRPREAAMKSSSGETKKSSPRAEKAY